MSPLKISVPSHFLSERPESKTSCSLSFERPKESEPKEKPSALLYRPIIKPQHLWLDCYFFFVSSNKEKVTKKKMPPSAVFFYTHSSFTPSWYSSDLILKHSCLHLCLSHVAIHSFIRKATAIHCGVLPLPFIPFAEYPFLLLRFLCFNSKGF